MDKEHKKNRHSRQRELIQSLLKENYNHPTADEIYEAARKTDPRISRGTVYRNLNLLADTGIIRKLALPLGPDHFDCRLDDHYHFVCRHCHKVFDLPIPYENSFNHTPDSMTGFKAEWHHLLLVGLCPSCTDQK